MHGRIGFDRGASSLAKVHLKALKQCRKYCMDDNPMDACTGGCKPVHNKKCKGMRKKFVALTVAVRNKDIADTPDGLHVAGYCSVHLNELSQA